MQRIISCRDPQACLRPPRGPPAHAAVRDWTGGGRFYKLPGNLPSGTHGTAIWVRKLTGQRCSRAPRATGCCSTADQRAAARRWVSGYGRDAQGQGAQGRLAGRDAGGMGRSGIADACAPCDRRHAGDLRQPLLNSRLKAGYAVVRTDFEGLGTPRRTRT